MKGRKQGLPAYSTNDVIHEPDASPDSSNLSFPELDKNTPPPPVPSLAVNLLHASAPIILLQTSCDAKLTEGETIKGTEK